MSPAPLSWKPRFRITFAVATLVVGRLLPGPSLHAETHLVESLQALQDKINEAAAGDMIVLKNGTYTTTAAISVNRRGAPGQPITLSAESVGGVEIAGTHGFTLQTPAAHIVVSGFNFTHTSGRSNIGAGTSHVRFTHNRFACVGEGPFLSVNGNDAQIDYNEFAEKKTPGSQLAVGGAGGQAAQRLWLHHNYFHDFGSPGSSGSEMLRVGLSALSLSTGSALVEHNLFSHCRGQNELLSNRSSGNTYRFNTFIDSPTSQMTLRHGNDCNVYGNVFRNTEGLRVFGDRHQVVSNYFEGNYIGINLGNGAVEVADGGSLTGHDRPDDCVIAFNTFVDNRTHLQMSKRNPNPLGATRTTIANNLLQGGGVGAKIEGPMTDASWIGNVIWNVATLGDFPANSFQSVDPLLSPDAHGLQHLQTGSPAIDAAVGEFRGVVADIDGQSRGEKKDIGADEVSTEATSARLLTPADVGPSAHRP